MIEKIDINEVERNLPSGIPSRIRALNSSGNIIASTPDNLLNAIEGINEFRRFFMPKFVSSGWMKIMEINIGSNCSFIINLTSFANQPNSIVVGYASVYNSSVMHCEFKSLVGETGEMYCPNIKYKKGNGVITVWATNNVAAPKTSCITLLHGSAEFPMTTDTPPEDAIQPIW